MSESDYPVKSAEEIQYFFNSTDKDYAIIKKFPVPGWIEGGMRRVNVMPKRHKSNKKRIAELKEKNHTEGLLTRELLELVEMESDSSEEDGDDEMNNGESNAKND